MPALAEKGTRKIYRLILKWMSLLISAGLLTGCAGSMSDLVIKIEPHRSFNSSTQEEVFQKAVEVLDIRKQLSMRRTTLGDISMGAVALSPAEPELVKALVVEALNDAYVGRTVPFEIPKIYCGIKTFDIETPPTPACWDVTARIKLILRVQGRERVVSGEEVERTWVWPGEKIITRVTTKALQNVSEETKKTLPILLEASP